MNTQQLLDNVAEKINAKNAIVVDAKEFLKALKFVVVATGKNPIHYVLTSIHVEASQNKLKLEATDGHMLTQQKVAANVSSELVGKEFLIDGKFAKNISKTVTKHGKQLLIEPIFYKHNEKATDKVKILDGNGELFIDDRFGDESYYPELEKVIPPKGKLSFETTKKELLPILKGLKKETSIKSNYDVHFEIQDNTKAVIGVGNNIHEINIDDLKIDDKYLVENNHGLNFQNDFNVKFLISELRNCDNTESLTFEFNKTLWPFYFVREKGGIGEITPLRVN